LSFDPKEYFTLGCSVAESAANEAAYRTAINRAYYACHLIGRESTLQKGWFVPTYSALDHKKLCRVLKDKAGYGSGVKLLSLYVNREHADYHTGSHPDDNECCRQDIDNIWSNSKATAEFLIPKLQSIFPTKSK